METKMKRGPILRLLILIALVVLLVASAQEEEPEVFVPSEKVPADSAVSFPTDI
jgi:hypothetical protein